MPSLLPAVPKACTQGQIFFVSSPPDYMMNSLKPPHICSVTDSKPGQSKQDNVDVVALVLYYSGRVGQDLQGSKGRWRSWSGGPQRV